MTPNLSLNDPAFVGVAGAVSGFDKSDGLVYWDFEQQTGDLTNQATSGNGWSDGLSSLADSVSLSVTARDATGKLGTYSYEFADAGSDEVRIGDQDALDILDDITISCWFQVTASSAGTGRIMLAKRPAAGTTCYQIFLGHGNGKLIWHDNVNGSIVKGSEVTLDVWHLAVFTISSGTLTTYLDGSSLGTSSVSTRDANAGDVVFGQTGFGTTEAFAGYIDDTAIFERGWTSEEVTTYWNDGDGMLFN